jgi:dihydroorotase
MTCYLTDATDPRGAARGYEEGVFAAVNVFAAVKLYPAHATTISEFGVTSIDRIMPVLERMAALGMPLLIHGEVTDLEVDVFDRETVFIDRVLDPVRRWLPDLRV